MSQMKLGIASDVWEHDNLLTALDKSIKLGFRVIELYGDPPHAFPSYMNDRIIDKILELKNRYDLSFTFHSPNSDSNAASSNPDARQMVVKQYRDSIIFAKKIGAEGVVVHTGRRSSRYASYEEAMVNVINTLKESVARAEENNVPFLLENEGNTCNRGFLQRPQDVLDIISEVNSEAIQICLDVSHARLRDISCADYIEKCAPKLTHIHMQDTDGFDDQHWPLGRGILDIPAIFNALSLVEFSGKVILEFFGGSTPEKNALECLKYLKSLENVHFDFDCVKNLPYLSKCV